MTLRIATIDDAGALASVHAAAWRDGYVEMLGHAVVDHAVPLRCTPAKWRSIVSGEIDAGSVVFMVEQDHECAGLLQAVARNEDTGEVMRMYVHPSSWRQGVGTQLMTAAVEHFERQGYKSVFVWAADTDRVRACTTNRFAASRRPGVVRRCVENARRSTTASALFSFRRTILIRRSTRTDLSCRPEAFLREMRFCRDW